MQRKILHNDRWWDLDPKALAPPGVAVYKSRPKSVKKDGFDYVDESQWWRVMRASEARPHKEAFQTRDQAVNFAWQGVTGGADLMAWALGQVLQLANRVTKLEHRIRELDPEKDQNP